MAGHDPVNNADPLNFIGAGVFSHNTSTKTWINAPGVTSTNRASYFKGQISHVAYYSYYVTTAELDAWWNPVPITGPIISGHSSSLCIDDSQSRTNNGNKIEIYSCTNNPNQNWTITPDGPGNAISVTINGVTKCMDVTGDGTTDHTLIQLYDCNGSPGEDWHLDSNGQLWNPNSNRCLDDPGASTTNGTQLQIYGCNQTNAQSWTAP
ncbi:ricin-type beta-trefoil lectin domain protein [Actinoallomurus sp. WRP6H-15]|nr:ricin-type beta-trefoil lectin domain protein [Actinoallomurus soli]